jgi:two-component system response regulator DegU
MEKIQIILVDDHAIVRDGIKQLLQKEENFLVLGEASNFAELLQLLKSYSPDIILMDISLPDKSGIEITKELSKNHPGIKIVMLSMHVNEEFILNSLDAGADGYLPKNTNKKELVECINTVFSGNQYFNSSVSNILLKSFIKNKKQEKSEKEDNTLSKREIEILKLYAEGYTNLEIAEKSGISIRTVESHKNHIIQKLNLKSPVDLIKYAIKNRIIDL